MPYSSIANGFALSCVFFFSGFFISLTLLYGLLFSVSYIRNDDLLPGSVEGKKHFAP